jgi:hypothetical protein
MSMNAVSWLLRKIGFRVVKSSAYDRLMSRCVELEAKCQLQSRRIAQLEKELGSMRGDHALESTATTAVAAATRRLKVFSSLDCPVFLHADNRLSFRPRPGTLTDRIAVISVPKSGTYLVGAVLDALAFRFCGVHGAEWGFSDQRFGSKREILGQLGGRLVQCDVGEYIDLVGPGEYILSHFSCNGKLLSLLATFRKIIVIRELRACLVSFMRYSAAHTLGTSVSAGWGAIPEGPRRMENFLRHDGANFFSLARPIAGWLGQNVCLVRFEELLGDRGENARDDAYQRIVRAVLDGNPAIPLMAENILRMDTLTKSPGRSRVEDYWSDEAEEEFRRFAGPDLNAILGYPG